ncbi:DUF2461 domain-containing protein [Leptospira levettii]|uniref:DUF2461 domain-containing protein n=1 Tax=Leptospira levettii TaxID=2023178 RepID=UPI0010837691|nr:DUF2461 domain-containing protein [Leptospira levettii]TGL03749.1 DUF2461 domain-containing protein [Leptospira levettii]
MKLSIEVIQFLSDLKKNNKRDWFLENKSRFDEIQKELLSYTGALLSGIEKFDSSMKGIDPKSCIFRIYKDVRFSKDKSPYKTHFGIFMRGGNRKIDGTGYYLHIEPDGSLLGGGCYQPDAQSLYKIRDRIANDSKGFLKIINDAKFYDTFGNEFYAEKVKTVPRGFAKDHPMIETLKYKGFAVAKNLKNGDLTSKLSSEDLVKLFRFVYPLNQFLDQAMNRK